MPQNKNSQKRITFLDECFSIRTGAYTLKKIMEVLVEKLDVYVYRKTIQNYIKYIKEIIKKKQGVYLDLHESAILFLNFTTPQKNNKRLAIE
jgi:hypothetical protein|tara:strand:+ start:60 stop:335 length:276 start_codon:yes stop_codon:yes gene_type:complete